MKTVSKWVLSAVGSFILLPACSSGSNKTAGNEPEAGIPDIRFVNVADIPKGIKEQENRKINPDNPPLVLDFTGEKVMKENFSFKEQFTNLSFVHLQHPLPLEKANFLYDASILYFYTQGMSSRGGVNSDVNVYDNDIIVSDFFGTFWYDSSGELKKVFSVEEGDYTYNADKAEIEYQYADKSTMKWGLTIEDTGSYRYFAIDTGNVFRMYRKSLQDDEIVYEMQFNDGRQMQYRNALNEGMDMGAIGGIFSPVLFNTYDSRTGDTLCVFTNYLLPKEIKGNYANPDNLWLYKLKGDNYYRQAYNDTIFRIESSNRLLPVYLLNFGQDRLDINTGLQGDKTNKLIPYKWIDMDNEILITYSRNYDCPNTRNSRTITFFYSYYDKNENKLYHLPFNDVYPDELIIPNDIPEGLPVIWNELSYQNGKLVSSYNKRKLEAMQKMKQFSSLPAEQKKRVKDLAGSIKENELIVMILN